MEKIPQSFLWNKEKNQITITGAMLIIFYVFKLLDFGVSVNPEELKKYIDFEK